MTKNIEYIQRYEREEHDSYTVIENSILKDERLSFRARGLLVYLLSFPKDWKIYVSSLYESKVERVKIPAKRNGKKIQITKDEGRSALLEAISELIAVGYVKRERLKDEKGRFYSHAMWVSRKPIFTETAIFPLSDNPTSDNQQLQSNNLIQNKEEISKDISSQNPKNAQKESKDPKEFPVAYELCSRFLYELKKLNPKMKEPNFRNWVLEMEKILRIDKRDSKEVMFLINESLKDSFWCSVILSPSNLRKNYDKLYMKFVKPIGCKSLNIEWLKAYISERERRGARGILSYNETEAFDSVLNKHCPIDNANLQEIVKSWY